MPDQIVGTAILVVGVLPHKLHVHCRRPNGTLLHQELPVSPKGTQDSSWHYEIKGDAIHVHPSVKITTTEPPNHTEVELFHNDGQWSVKFKLCERGEDCYERFRRENPVPE